MFSFKRRPVAAAIVALFSTPPVLAQTQALPEVSVQGQAERAEGPVEGYRATRSATFTRTDTPLNEVPASVTVVPAQLVKDQAMQSMADVIRYVPGALAHQGEGNRDDIVIRGIRTNADFYVDGIRDDAQIYRDLYNLERIEVLKGPGGMMFGRGGAGGIVNRVTKKAAFEPVREATVTLGSWTQRRAAVDLGNRIGESAAWRLNAMTEESDGFRNGFELSRYAVNPTVTFMPGAQTSITLGYENVYDSRSNTTSAAACSSGTARGSRTTTSSIRTSFRAAPSTAQAI
jgi:catecholate siderophore receptor